MDQAAIFAPVMEGGFWQPAERMRLLQERLHCLKHYGSGGLLRRFGALRVTRFLWEEEKFRSENRSINDHTYGKTRSCCVYFKYRWRVLYIESQSQEQRSLRVIEWKIQIIGFAESKIALMFIFNFK